MLGEGLFFCSNVCPSSWGYNWTWLQLGGAYVLGAGAGSSVGQLASSQRGGGVNYTSKAARRACLIQFIRTKHWQIGCERVTPTRLSLFTCAAPASPPRRTPRVARAVCFMQWLLRRRDSGLPQNSPQSWIEQRNTSHLCPTHCYQ